MIISFVFFLIFHLGFAIMTTIVLLIALFYQIRYYYHYWPFSFPLPPSLPSPSVPPTFTAVLVLYSHSILHPPIPYPPKHPLSCFPFRSSSHTTSTRHDLTSQSQSGKLWTLDLGPGVTIFDRTNFFWILTLNSRF